MMRRLGLAALAYATLASLGWAQSSPNFSYGQVPTAGQWNAAFASKQDRLTFSPINKAGDTMSGRLQTAPATVNGAGFAILPGIAPSTPANGDLWATGSGLFARIGSQTLSLGAYNPASVAITGGTINGTTIGGTTPAPANFTTLAANALALGTPLPLTQGGCGATTALGCLTSLGLASGTAGQVLTSNGPGAAPSYQPVSTASNAVLYTAQSPTSGQQDQVRANISGAVPSTPSASATLATTDIERPYLATGSITLTVPNGGAGWRTGSIKNANAITGLVTLAVPSGATLDGVTNGTTVLSPYQRARIIQTGASAYATDWIEQSPIVAQSQITTGVASADFNLPAGYTKFRVEVTGIAFSATATFGVRFSDNGATGVKAGTNDYYTLRQLANANNVSVSQQFGDSYGYLMTGAASNATYRANAEFVLYPGGSGYPSLIGESGYLDASGPYRTVSTQSIDYAGTTGGSIGRVNLLRLYVSAGTATFNATIRGLP